MVSSQDLQDLKSDLAKFITDKLNNVNKNINNRHAELTQKIDGFNQRLVTLENTLEKTQKQNEELETRVEQLEKKLDDQINRSMRQTLIFKGLPEPEKGKENDGYEQSSQQIAEHISQCSKGTIATKEILENIDRAHRSLNTKTNKKTRHVYVKFMS